MTIMISFTLCTIGDLIHVLIHYHNASYHKLKRNTISDDRYAAIVDAIYFFGDVLFYLLILLRISIPFELNKGMSYLLRFIIFIFGITSTVYCICLFLHINDYNAGWNWIVFILSFTDLLLTPCILIIFILKMKKTIINVDPSLSKESEKNVNLMTNIMTKHAVLFGIAIFINQGFYMTLIYDHFVNDYTVISYVSATYGIRSIETLANTLILWLLLRINYEKYITICRCCHILIGKCCFKNIEFNPAVDNPYQELMNNL